MRPVNRPVVIQKVVEAVALVAPPPPEPPPCNWQITMNGASVAVGGGGGPMFIEAIRLGRVDGRPIPAHTETQEMIGIGLGVPFLYNKSWREQYRCDRAFLTQNASQRVSECTATIFGTATYSYGGPNGWFTQQTFGPFGSGITSIPGWGMINSNSNQPVVVTVGVALTDR